MAAIQNTVPAPASKVERACITPQERREREEAVKFAHANVGLEGFTQSPETIALTQRYIDGEIELDELLALGIRGK